MKLRSVILFLLCLAAVFAPWRAPAPLIYVPGEGWYYENYGSHAKWQRSRAKDQLEVAEQAFTNKDYAITMHAAHRILRVWPLSDYAPQAEYLVARCLESEHKDEAAFNAYQEVMKKYPKSGQYNEVLWRQYDIANRFLGGQWFKLWNMVPLYPSMDQTAKLYEKIVNNGPYSEVAPHAQLRMGAAREKQGDYGEAVKAYTTASDRYQDQHDIAADAMYRTGWSWEKQADTAEYDQGAAAQAIAAYTDFITFYPDDKRVADAQKSIAKLKTEQVRGNFEIAKFYENGHKWAGAIVYYNAVLQLDANSPLAAQARQRIEVLKPRLVSVTSAAK
jgi:outer membrane protein assembly factor BamD